MQENSKEEKLGDTEYTSRSLSIHLQSVPNEKEEIKK